MPWTKAATSGLASERVDWVDYAKGWCIILVVMMHATLGVEEAVGHDTWLSGFIAWARPFRMPDFFLVAGLFLSRVIDKPWRHYLDRKVLHFAYFFVLWTLIQGVPKLLLVDPSPGAVLDGLAFAMIEPYGTLWFIYLLPIFFVTTKLLRRVTPAYVLLVAAALQSARIFTDWVVIDEFAARYVYFFAGYLFAPLIFALAAAVRANAARAIAALVVWAFVNFLFVRIGLAQLPLISLALGFAGAAAVVSFSALLAEARLLPALRWLGGQSLAIYLAFFLPMALTRVALLKSGLIADAGTVAAIVTVVAVLVPTFVKQATRSTRFAFLFERPALFRLERRAPAARPQAAAPRKATAPPRADLWIASTEPPVAP